jgi:hypothetical protein
MRASTFCESFLTLVADDHLMRGLTRVRQFFVILKSDTPREAGGLVSGPPQGRLPRWFCRRAKARLCAMTLKTSCSIRFLLLAVALIRFQITVNQYVPLQCRD